MKIHLEKSDEPRSRRSRSRLRRLLVGLGVVVALFLLTLVLVLAAGPTVDLRRLVPRLETAATAALAMPVEIGALRTSLRLTPTVEVSGLRLGAADPPCARIASAELVLPLLPLLWRDELRLDRLELVGVDVGVPRCLTEWPRGERPRSASEEPAGAAAPASRRGLRLLAVDELALEDVRVLLPGGETGHEVEIEEWRLRGPAGEPVTLEGLAALDSHPVALSGSGGEIEQLQGSEPWPLGLRLTSGGVELRAAGAVPLGGEGTPFEIDLSLHATPASELFEMVERSAMSGAEVAVAGTPALQGPLALQGHLALGAGEARVTDLRGELADSTVRGRGRASTADGRLRIEAELELPRLALEPWLPAGGSRGRDDVPDGVDRTPGYDGDEASGWLQIELAPFLEWLALVDGKIDFEADEITGLPLSVLQSRGHLLLHDSAAQLRLSADVAGSPVTVEATAAADPLRPLRLAGEAHDLAPTRWLAGLEGFEAGDRCDSLRLLVETSGATLGEALERLDAEVDLRGMAFTRRPDGELPKWSLRDGEVALRQRPGSGLELVASGHANGAPVKLELGTAPVAGLRRGGALPLKLSVDAPQLTANLAGTASLAGARPTFDLALEIALERLGAIAPWSGIATSAEAPLFAEGNLRRSSDGRLELALPRLQLGRSRGSLELTDVPLGEDPWLRLALDAAVLDLDEILGTGRQLFERPTGGRPGRPRGAESTGGRRSDGDSLGDLDRRVVIELEAALIERRGVDITNAELQLTVERDGSADSRVGFRVGRAPFAGSLDVDVTDGGARVRFAADTSELDIGAALAEEGWVESLQLEAGRVGIAATSEGSSVSELWHSTRASFELDDIVWHPELGPAEGADAGDEVRVDVLRISSSETEGLLATGRGHYRGVPVAIELLTDRLLHAEERERGTPHPFRLRLDAEPDATLVLDGVTKLPFAADELSLHAEVSGRDLAWWRALLGLDLPALGPYEVSADLRVAEERLELSGLALALGGSRATGAVTIDWSLDPTRIAGSLDWSELFLRDVVVEGAMQEVVGAAEVTTRVDGDTSEVGSSRQPAAGRPTEMPASETRWRLEREWFLDRDVDLAMTVEAFHGELRDASTPGTLSAALRLVDGNLALGPIHFEAADGSIDGSLTVTSALDGATTSLALRVEDFDYSPLTRRLAPEVEEAGRLSLYADLEATAGWGEPLGPATHGTLAALVVPEQADAFLLDLWGDDVLRNLFTVLGWASSPSAVNCLSARGTLEAGAMNDLRVLADTTRVRIRGKGRLDLGEQTIRVRLRPKPKRRTLLNLATPVSIRGDLLDPEIRPASGTLVELGVRTVSWIYVVYLQLLKKPLPPTDLAACVDLLEGYVEDERWRPGSILVDPSSLVEKVVEPR